MKKIITFKSKPIVIELKSIGNDVLIVVYGGNQSHIGGYSTSYSEGNKTMYSNNSLPGHKDVLLSDCIVKELTDAKDRTYHCVCGIHYNTISKEEIRALVQLCLKEVDYLYQKWSEANGI